MLGHVAHLLFALAATQHSGGQFHSSSDHGRRISDIAWEHRVLVHDALDDVLHSSAAQDPDAFHTLLDKRLLGAKRHVIIGGPDGGHLPGLL